MDSFQKYAFGTLHNSDSLVQYYQFKQRRIKWLFDRILKKNDRVPFDIIDPLLARSQVKEVSQNEENVSKKSNNETW